MNVRSMVSTALVAAVLCLATNSQVVFAVPGFAKSTEVTCSSCHTVFPQLTEMGREFKRSGYDTIALKNLDDKLDMERTAPVSARINLRVIDKRTSKLSTSDELSDKDKQLKNRALHELEVFLAGRAGKRISYFLEIEAEDEWPDPNGDAPGFQVQLATGAVQVILNEHFTAYGGYVSPFYADGYNTLDYHKVTRRAWSASAKGFVPSEGQVIGVAGRSRKVSGLLAWGGNSGDLEGHDPEDFSGRIAVDAAPGIMIGGWGNVTQIYDSGLGESDEAFYRYGVDGQIDTDQFSVNAVFAVFDEDRSDVKETNISVEALLLKEVGRPFLASVAPVIGIDRYTVSNRDESFVDLGVFLTVVHRDNFRTQIGWEGNVSTPDAYQHKESRITFVVDVGL